MSKSLTVKRSFHVRKGAKAKRQIREGESVPEEVPRISRLMALAIHFDELIRTGVVKDQAEIARLAQVSRARLTQILNLLCLAPELQEQILFFEAPNYGHDPVTERSLRTVAATPEWSAQLRSCKQLQI
ncbi:MAG: hypothetical protein MPJ50_19435 [Pirellulales bacterium]|nr:hypothetical protein [Pirellulales bacterium]